MRKFVFIWMVCLNCFSISLTYGQEALLGSGKITRADGMASYFIIGSFFTREKCEKNVHWLIGEIISKAKWVGQNLSSQINPCLARFAENSKYELLYRELDSVHYVLFHESIRLMIVHPQGILSEEKAVCEKIQEGFDKLLHIHSKCIAPKG
ncbi:MAG: hypothetical protein H7832_02320 [Magnetococcus sp. DMHC-6]